MKDFKSKGQNRTVDSSPQVIQANIYEEPKFALDLVAHICTEKEDIEIDSYFDVYKQKFENLRKEVSNLDDKLSQIDDASKSFWDRKIVPLLDTLKYLYWDASDAVLNTSSSKLKIAVAGGYSAGKSSLLNALTAIGEKLPVGIEPVSVINTQLNCKRRNSEDEEIAIRGINIADKYVKLDEEVLSCIKHSNRSKVSLASVLKSIILDIPSPDFLDGITFIDTPGYNNSPDTSNTSDRETARKGIETSDVVFWCINIETGAIKGKDLEILTKIDSAGKPSFVFFTKMDKKTETERKNIIMLASSQIREKLKNCVGAAGISSVNNTVNFYSPSAKFGDVASVVRYFSQQYAKTSVGNDFVSRLEQAFDEVIEYLVQCSNNCESNRLKMIDNKNKIPEILRIYKKEKSETAKILSKNNPTIDLTNAKQAVQAAIDSGNYKLRNILNFLNGDVNFESIIPYQKDMLNDFGKTVIKMYLDRERNPIVANWLEKLTKLHRILESPYRDFLGATEQLLDAFNNDSTPNSELIENVMALYDEKIEKLEDQENSFYQAITTVRNDKQIYDEIRKILCNYKQQLSNALKYAYANAKNKVQDYLQKLKSPNENNSESSNADIFAAIQNDDFTAFVRCFSGKGVNMLQRYDGYSPLTYAVSQGNNLMVKFFIEHDARLTDKDGNGLNAFETAVKFHYQDICEILLKKDEALPKKCEHDLKELYNQNTFKNYIESKI